MDSVLCECVCSEFRPSSRPTVEHIQRFKTFPNLYRNGCKSDVIENYWRQRILLPYSRRILTKSTDKLVALTAVASRFQSEFGLTYLAGLWKDDLIRELLWSIDYSRPAEKYASIRQESYYAPTWSWVSVDAPMSWYPFREDGRTSKPLARVLGTINRPLTLNPFGPVSEGRIKLSAMIWPATARYNDARGCWEIVDTEIELSLLKYIKGGTIRFDTLSRVTMAKGELAQDLLATCLRQGEGENDERNPKVPVTAMPLLNTRDSKTQYGTVYGLIIQKSVTSDGFWERLGVFGHFCDIFYIDVKKWRGKK